MSVRKSLLLTLTATLLMVQLAVAQTEARLQIVQTGIDDLKSDLKYLVELSPNPSLKKQWAASLEPLIDSFTEGLDTKKPIRVDVVIGKDVSYEIHIPITKLDGPKGFIPNITGFGFIVKRLGGDLYSVAEDTGGGPKAQAKKPMYMRHVNGYASFAATQAGVPANLPHPINDPAKGVAALMARGYDVMASLKNSAAPADITARKSNFQELRKQLEAGLAFRRNEDKNDFALRKLSLIQNLNEAERFVVETDELVFGWSTIAATKETPGRGRAEFSILPLAGTNLAASTDVLAAQSSYFANVVINPNAVISGKINFGIDPLRSAHLTQFYMTVRPVLELQVDKRATLKDAEQKKAVKQAAGLLLDMLSEGIPLGTADLFLDVHSAGDGKHTLICGVRAANGKKADEIVKLLPKVNAGRDVKLDIQKIGDDVSLHSIAVPERRLAAFQKLFPGEKLIYVATSKDAVWGAAGTNAVAELEVAIKQVAANAPPEQVDPRVVSLTAQAARLVELMDIVRPEPQKIDEKLSKEEQSRLKARDKELEKVRKLAIEATSKCDAIFSAEVKKNGSKVEGSLDVSECVLTFIGSIIGDFATTLK